METAEIPETKGVPGMTAPAAMETALTEIPEMDREITAVPGMDPETAPGGSYRPVKSTGFICPQVSARETAGQWIQTGEDWQFRFSGGAMAMDCWIFKGGEWYHMGADSLMDRGWHYQKETGSWYYLRENGAMKKGWIQLSGIWYYLGTADGRMAVGWQSIGEKWYYLNPAEPVPVPATDPVTGQTVQSTEGQLPYGAMYQNRKTPDGFMTGADGAWME